MGFGQRLHLSPLREAIAMKTCACGVPISARATRCTRCRCRLAQARYERTQKGLAAYRRYVSSAKGRRRQDRQNQQRIFVGEVYYGRAPHAAQINQYIKERKREFIARQSHREEAEGASAGGVSPEAAI